MKKIINGRRYDTDTAELLCNLECKAFAGAWDWHDTALYRTKSGAFFLAGWGMGGSMWGEELYDCTDRVRGEGLRVLTNEEAREILEQEDQVEIIEAFFEVEDA